MRVGQRYSSSLISIAILYNEVISSYALSSTSTKTDQTQSSIKLPNKNKEPIGKPPPEIWPELVVGGSEDPAMGRIEQNQASINKKYGDVLDAGTGIYSLRWLAGLLYRHSSPNDPLHMTSYVAVTADDNFRTDCQKKAEELGISEWGSVVRGNWDIQNAENIDSSEKDENDQNNRLCNGQMFDTILADYLVGAVDHFSPFYQDQLFTRLSSHLRKGGVMHLTGLNPIPEMIGGPGNIFCRITKLRDACILLAGSRPYRGESI